MLALKILKATYPPGPDGKQLISVEPIYTAKQEAEFRKRHSRAKIEEN